MRTLPQTYSVGRLIEAAQEALLQLPEGETRDMLECCIESFTCTVTLTAWSVEDVLDVRPDMTEEEAVDTLTLMEARYELNQGDWYFLEDCAEDVKEKPEEEENEEEEEEETNT